MSRPIIYEESIAHFEAHAHLSCASSTFNNSDEIRIVQNEDHCLLRTKSSLYIQGRLVNQDRTLVTYTRLIINGMYHLFEEARYELNAVEIDRNMNVGLTNLLKNYTSVYEGHYLYFEPWQH